MPSEHRRRKDDTWTSDELNRALKGPKDDMHRRKRKEDDGDHRRHRDDGTGSERRHGDSRRSQHGHDDDRRSSKHRGRGDSPEHAVLTEEERERQRQERRAKREGGKEEKKPKAKENKPSKVIIDDEDDDDGGRRRHKDDDRRHGDRRHPREEDSRRHKERGENRSHHRDDRDGGRDKSHRDDRDSKRHREDVDERKRRHHRDEDSSSKTADRDSDRRRHHDDSDRRRHHDDSDRRRHHDDSDRRRHHDDSDRRRHDDDGRDRRHKDESSSHRRRRVDEDNDDDEEERERKRQERRDRREKDKQKDKDSVKDREKDSHRERRREDPEQGRDKYERKERDEGRRRQRRDEDDEAESSVRRREVEESVHSRRQESAKHTAANGKVKVEEAEDEGDDYNYEEDFEDYEDDFEDDEDPEMKEEGEMEEVLRALDEENNRLVSASRRSNWSDSTELSDERFKDTKELEESGPQMVPRAKTTFINFVSAKQRVMTSTVASKARKRAEDLSKLIELDVAKYDMFDLPPVKEYELYIRSFGRSDTKQAYVQTHEDDIDRDVQTEEVDSLSKWTQQPPENDTAVGGEGISVMASADQEAEWRKTDPVKLNQFLERVGQFLFTILDEESKSSYEEERRRDGRPTASFSDSVTQLGSPNFLTGRMVQACSFCPSETNSLLTVHSLPYDSEEHTDLAVPRSSSPVDKGEQPYLNRLSLVCVWNVSQPTYPYRICSSEMLITCACFSPLKASLVFAGMHDGSVALWDVREAAAQHRTLELQGEEHLVRFPTYNTAGVLESENHTSPVVSIVAVHSSIVGSLKDDSATESSSGLSFQVASVEERAVVNLWVVAELSAPDPAGSTNDLGLSPGGKIKVLRSSSIMLHNPHRYMSTSSDLRALTMQLSPGDLNHFYVGTDAGCVVHGVRFGTRAFPQSHSSLIDSPVPVVSIDFSPFGQPYFLAGCQDGSLHLYHTKLENPIASWREFIAGEKILSVRWSRSRPAVFFVLDNNSTVFTFDLVENGLGPMRSDRITSADAMSMEVGGDPNLMTVGVSRPAYMVFPLDSGSVEILTVSEPMRQQQPLEEDFLASYVDRY